VSLTYRNEAASLLAKFADDQRDYVTSQMLRSRRRFELATSPGLDDATIFESSLKAFGSLWTNEEAKLNVIPGKEALRMINTHLQKHYGVAVTPMTIIDAMLVDEVPEEMVKLIDLLAAFITARPRPIAA
jgi:hypothetical protein